MKVGDLVLDWYYPGFGLVVAIVPAHGKDAPPLVKVYFSESRITEWRYDEELVVVGEGFYTDDDDENST